MISLKSENQTLKKYIKENQTVNITKRFENSMNKKSLSENFIDECLSSNSNGMNKINQIFQTLNKSLNTYYYSYSKPHFLIQNNLALHLFKKKISKIFYSVTKTSHY